MRSRWAQFPLPFQLDWGSRATRLAWLALALAAGTAVAALPLPVAGLLVAGGAAVTATLIQPLVGLTLALLAGPFGALESVIVGGASLDSSQLLLALTLCAWLARGVARREIRLPRTGRVVGVPLLAFAAIGALSLVSAPSLALGFKELAKWVEMGLVAWVVVDLAGRQEARAARSRWIVAAVLASGLVQALIGVWQFGLRGHGPEHFLILHRFYRAYGSFEQPNPFAGFLGLALPLALGACIGLLHRKRSDQASAFIHQAAGVGALLLAAAVLAAALLMSWSRGGWLGASAGLAAMIVLLPRRGWVRLLVIVGLATIAWAGLQSGLVPQSIAGRLSGFSEYLEVQDARGADITPENYAVLERVAHWQAALAMADDRPWLGVGLGNYQAAYADYALLNWPYPLGHAHNYYLNLLAETGALGLAAYLLFWATVVVLTVRVLRRAPYPRRGLALGLMGTWVHLSVHHLVDKLYVNNIYLHLGALLGLLLIVADEGNAEPD